MEGGAGGEFEGEGGGRGAESEDGVGGDVGGEEGEAQERDGCRDGGVGGDGNGEVMCDTFVRCGMMRG